jgi:hypothetical protein
VPTSHYRQIPDVIEAVLAIDPRSILEVGIGCGKYGALLREYLTVWGHYFEPWGGVPLRMVGIEIHALYADSPAWACYDQVIIGDALEVVPGVKEQFDLALIVDVLEHFDKEGGARLLVALLERAPRVLVALPAIVGETVEVWGNPHEVHRVGWMADEVRDLGLSVQLLHDDDYRLMVVSR